MELTLDIHQNLHGYFIAICREFDMVIQGRDFNEMKERVDEIIYGHAAICAKENLVPFECVRYENDQPICRGYVGENSHIGRVILDTDEMNKMKIRSKIYELLNK